MPVAVPSVSMMKRTAVLAILSVSVLVAGCGGSDDTGTAASTTAAAVTTPAAPEATQAPAPTAAPTTAAPTTEANTAKISLDEFNQLQTGMSYEQAVAVIGGEGAKLSESSFGDVTTVMYQWDGSNDSGFGANANAMFQGDKLVSKAQLGLK